MVEISKTKNFLWAYRKTTCLKCGKKKVVRKSPNIISHYCSEECRRLAHIEKIKENQMKKKLEKTT